MKNKILILLAFVMALAFAMPASGQSYAAIWYGGTPPTTCNPPSQGYDITNGRLYTCKAGVWQSDLWMAGAFQGTTATAITDGAFNKLTGPAIKIPAGTINRANSHVRITMKGVYTTAAASLLNVEINLCQVLGCASGTTLAPAGCVVISTNQANVLANGQWEATCDLTTATTGTGGTLMAKAKAGFQLGAATSAALSYFADTATAASAGVDLTVDEFVHPHFKFTTLNAGNTATLQQMTVEISFGQ